MLNVVSLSKAKEIIDGAAVYSKIEYETVGLNAALSRVVCEDIISGEDIPSFNRSTVDGFAVKAADTFGSGESIPCQLDIKGEILMGQQAKDNINDGECVRISTGGMIPEGADSVVMVENTDCTFEEFCLIFKAVSPFENVIRKGDDIKKDSVIIRKGTVITSRHIGILASLGISTVKVFRKIRVGIISTGDELVSIDTPLSVGKIRDINTHILSALIDEMGCIGTEYGIIDDKYADILSAVKRAVKENDIVLISGGSSAGVKDMTVKVISEIGRVDFHGIALKPGKPTIFGVCDGKAVFGLPGHPSAAYYVTLLTVKNLIDKIYHRENMRKEIICTISQNVSSNHGREEIVGVRIEKGTAIPVFAKSGFISSLSHADGYVIINRNSEGIKKGDTVKVNLF